MTCDKLIQTLTDRQESGELERKIMNITIRGKSFPGDFYDVDFIENYETAASELQRKTEEAKTTPRKSTADGYRALIRTVDEFFDAVLGDGAAAQIFEGAEGNVRIHLEAVDELSGQAAEQKKGLNDITNRYTQRQAARAQAPSQVVQFNPHGKGKRRR